MYEHNSALCLGVANVNEGEKWLYFFLSFHFKRGYLQNFIKKHENVNTCPHNTFSTLSELAYVIYNPFNSCIIYIFPRNKKFIKMEGSYVFTG